MHIVSRGRRGWMSAKVRMSMFRASARRRGGRESLLTKYSQAHSVVEASTSRACAMTRGDVLLDAEEPLQKEAGMSSSMSHSSSSRMVDSCLR